MAFNIQNKKYLMAYTFFVLLFIAAPVFDYLRTGCFGGHLGNQRLVCGPEAEREVVANVITILVLSLFGFWTFFSPIDSESALQKLSAGAPGRRLNIKSSSEGGHVFYFIRITDGPVYKTIHFEDVHCGLFDADIVFVELFDLDENLSKQFVQLSEDHDGVTKIPKGFRVDISNSGIETTAECMVNIDVDDSGRILSIEIV